ncbi:MAG: DnaD domain protein [Lachnospiraceae bacterium]|nr:DnaD domain protein [Lachnospiraceae bacterium]
MSEFKVYQDYCLDATLVSNVFIDNYMGNANDAQIKIYLYLLRVLCAHKSCSISDLADQFNYTEKDVTRALKYWEKNGLLSLEYDASKNLTGVRLLDLDSTSNGAQGQIRQVYPPEDNTVTLAPIVQIPLRTEAKTVPAPAASAPAVSAPEKRIYTADDINEFKNSEGFNELIFIIEQYLGKTLTATDIRTLMYLKDDLKFSTDLIYFLFEYCVGKGKKDLRYIEKVALGWYEEGIKTPKEASRSTSKYDKEVYEIMKLLGKNSVPTKSEVAFITRWRNEFGYGLEIISEACGRTVMATDKHRFEYADKILQSWNTSGVKTTADIAQLDERFTEKKTRDQSKTQVPQYKKFSHRDSSSDSDLEKELLSN